MPVHFDTMPATSSSVTSSRKYEVFSWTLLKVRRSSSTFVSSCGILPYLISAANPSFSHAFGALLLGAQLLELGLRSFDLLDDFLFTEPPARASRWLFLPAPPPRAIPLRDGLFDAGSRSFFSACSSI